MSGIKTARGLKSRSGSSVKKWKKLSEGNSSGGRKVLEWPKCGKIDLKRLKRATNLHSLQLDQFLHPHNFKE